MNLQEIEKKNFKSALNYIYSDSELEELDDDVKKWIISEKNNQAIHEEISRDQESAINKWWEVCEKTHSLYENYINQFKDSSEKIEILIVSEAPMLTLKGDKFLCNYILGDGPVGSYRTVPYESIWEYKNLKDKIENDNYKTDKDEIIKLFIDNNVAFIDLIPFPIPQVATNLRKLWQDKKSTEFIFTLFNNAIDKIKETSEREFSEELKIILMMPPTTAAGIINFCIINSKKNDNAFLNQHLHKIIRCNDNSIFKRNELLKYSIKLHRQVVMSGAGGPIKELFINALEK